MHERMEVVIPAELQSDLPSYVSFFTNAEFTSIDSGRRRVADSLQFVYDTAQLRRKQPDWGTANKASRCFLSALLSAILYANLLLTEQETVLLVTTTIRVTWSHVHNSTSHHRALVSPASRVFARRRSPLEHVMC
jgi:hypothetical protein